MSKVDKSLSSSDKFLAVIAYFGPFCILPLVLRRDSSFCQTHGKQGLVLALVFWILKGVGAISSPIFYLIGLAQIVTLVTGAVFAAQGKIIEFPVVSDMAKKLEL